MHPTAGLDVLFGNANADVVTHDRLTGRNVDQGYFVTLGHSIDQSDHRCTAMFANLRARFQSTRCDHNGDIVVIVHGDDGVHNRIHIKSSLQIIT